MEVYFIYLIMTCDRLVKETYIKLVTIYSSSLCVSSLVVSLSLLI